MYGTETKCHDDILISENDLRGKERFAPMPQSRFAF